jgi:hypothetical protein
VALAGFCTVPSIFLEHSDRSCLFFHCSFRPSHPTLEMLAGADLGEGWATGVNVADASEQAQACHILCVDSHMRTSHQFSEKQEGCGLGAALPADATLKRRGQIFPHTSPSWLLREPGVTGSFVWGVGGDPGGVTSRQ